MLVQLPYPVLLNCFLLFCSATVATLFTIDRRSRISPLHNISADKRWLRVDGEASSGIGELLLQASILSLIRFIKCYPSHDNKNLPFVLSNAETSPLIVSLSYSYSLMVDDAV